LSREDRVPAANRLLLNLILNAIEAMRERAGGGGAGKLPDQQAVTNRNGRVRSKVRDNSGFRLCLGGYSTAVSIEAFYTHETEVGLGLGLSICRSIIRRRITDDCGRVQHVPRGAIFGFIAPIHPGRCVVKWSGASGSATRTNIESSRQSNQWWWSRKMGDHYDRAG